MAEIESDLLKIEDFVRTTKPDGTLILTHRTLNDEIELGPNESPLWFFLKVREFSEKHGILMCPELAKLTNGLEEEFHQGLRRFEDGLSDTIDEAIEDELGDDDSEFYTP